MPERLNQIARAWRESSIIQGLLALIVVGAYVGTVFAGIEDKQYLEFLVGAVLGYYFGVKAVQTGRRS